MYRRVLEVVRGRYGRSVKTCWIADVKEGLGLNPRRAWNRLPGTGRANPCPGWARPLIEEAVRSL